jgi:hypothetical protein
MASSIFLDTNGWLSLLNSTESMHAEADRFWREFVRSKRPFVLTDWVVAETGNGLARFSRKGQFRDALNRILQNPRGEIVFVDDVLMGLALDYFARYADKSWGLVDCASFVVMQQRGITEAFTSDRHFEQAGFACLLPGNTQVG